ncbi:uncharacterized protein LOC134681555 [Mytilus trossulus]|uniref:uncharacterized protein LOC134681555 n=1 Tax=Mytilus trossulus TaxID=6551 RepID=UPI0030059517
MSYKVFLVLCLIITLTLSNASLEELEIQMHAKFNNIESLWEDRFQKLEQIVGRQEAEINKLKDELDKVKLSDGEKERQLADLKAYISNLFLGYSPRKRVGIVQRDVEEGEERQRKVRAAQETTAFYAYMSHVEWHPSPHHTLLFDVSITNVNGGYSEYTGIFTAPYNGTFVISANSGDKIFVRTHSTLDHAGDIGSDDNGRTWFAGWLI